MSEKLYFNGDIITMEEGITAEAVLIKDKWFVKVGTLSEVKKAASEEVEEIDLQGKTMMPSFIDAHSHFTGYAYSLIEVSLESAENFEDIAKAIEEFIKDNKVPEGE